MYFKFDKKNGLLKVDDTFASLISIDDDSVTFSFKYEISSIDAIRSNATIVNVKVLSKIVDKKTVSRIIHSKNTTNADVIKTILRQTIDEKDSIKQQEKFIVANKNNNVLSSVNNEIISQIKKGIPTESIQQLKKTKLVLVPASTIKSTVDVKPVLNLQAHSFMNEMNNSSSSYKDSASYLMQDMIVRQGIDPSSISTLTHRSYTAENSFQGTLRKSRGQEVETGSSTKLLNSFVHSARKTNTDGLSEQSYVQVATVVTDPNVRNNVVVKIPNSAFIIDGSENYSLLVKIDLVDSKSGLSLDSVLKQLDVTKHIQLFKIPRIAPIVNVCKSDISTKTNLEIRQLDETATGIKLFKKIISMVEPGSNDYELIGEFNVTSKQKTLLIQVDNPKNSTFVYRVVPTNDGTLGFEYTNVIVGPSNYVLASSVSLTISSIDSGAKLEIRKIPFDVISVQFMVRNASIFEKTYSAVESVIHLIDEPTRGLDYVSTIDQNVFDDCVYEYAVRLTYRTGISKIVGYAIFERIKQEQGKVNVNANNVVISSIGKPNTQFAISTDLLDGHLDTIKKLLQSQGSYDLYKDAVLSERDSLKSLIAHNVKRIDLSTGVVNDFGVISETQFSDVDFAPNNSVEPLKMGHKYRYEITPLLRNPETLFDSRTLEKIDVNTKKAYKFKPSKHLHPLTLKKGTIVSSIGAATKFGKEQMMYGEVGSTTSVEVSFDVEQASITNSIASRYNDNMIVVSWKINGAIDQVDHFLIMKNVLGVKTVVGKAHSEFEQGHCQFIHSLTSHDTGNLQYEIVPIMNDYRVGKSVVTNVVNVQ